MSSLDAASERRVWLLDFVYFVDVVPGARQVVAQTHTVRGSVCAAASPRLVARRFGVSRAHAPPTPPDLDLPRPGAPLALGAAAACAGPRPLGWLSSRHRRYAWVTSKR